jgi:protein-S-isoprenylcysteine O-methyltransferase Ste14
MTRDGAAIKTILFLILVPGTVAGWAPYWLLQGGGRFDVGALRLAGIIPIGLGTVILLWCFWEFVYSGRGTPAPIDPPKQLVVGGLYRFVRNPMYVGVGLILIGESLLFESGRLFVYTLGVGVVFNLFVLFYEEPTLRKKFGYEYAAYCRSVPRWLPRLWRRRT